jgi:hypothetical protein
MRREASRVSFLMCPFCVRAQLLCETTDAAAAASKLVAARAGSSWSVASALTRRRLRASRTGVDKGVTAAGVGSVGQPSRAAHSSERRRRERVRP